MHNRSQSYEYTRRSPASRSRDTNNLPAHDDHHAARSGRDNSRSVQSSDHQPSMNNGLLHTQLTTQHDLELFEQFIQLQGLNSERSAALRQRLTNDVFQISGSTSHHDVQQPSRGSTGTTDFVQSHAVNYQSVLGANNSLASNQANFLVIQGFANRNKAYFVDFPTMTLPSVMQT